MRCLEGGWILEVFSSGDTVPNISLGLGLKLVKEEIFTCTLPSSSLLLVLKINFFVRTF